MKIHKSFLINDDEFLKKYNEVQDKVKNSINKDFDSEAVNNKKYLKAVKAKVKSYNVKINANFNNNKITNVLNVFAHQ